MKNACDCFEGTSNWRFFRETWGLGQVFVHRMTFGSLVQHFFGKKAPRKTSKICSTGLALVVLVCLICWISGDRQEKNKTIRGVWDFSLDLRDQLIIQLVNISELETMSVAEASFFCVDCNPFDPSARMAWMARNSPQQVIMWPQSQTLQFSHDLLLY